MATKRLSRPYTDEDRARLLAPITIRRFGGGKSWGGTSLGVHMVGRSFNRDDDPTYGQFEDRRDLDGLK